MNASKFLLPLVLIVAAPISQAIAQEELGPLAQVLDQQLRDGWTTLREDGWFVLRNEAAEDSEQTLFINAGAPPQSGRTTSVNVSLTSSEVDAAIGIMARNVSSDDICLMEITAKAAANLFCNIGGEHDPIANIPGAAKMDGSDVIEMVEVPGSATFFLNGTEIGTVTHQTALGGELGIMAYDIGTFGLADFTITDAPAAAASGSGLPPKGGKTGQGGTAGETGDVPAGDDTSAIVSAIMGPLGGPILAAEDKEGWELFLKDIWLVVVNAATASSERFYSMPLGPLESGERVTSVSVGILPPEGSDAADFPKSAAGLVIDSADRTTSCIGEITGSKDALVLCFNADGTSTELGRLPGAALGDGKDVIEFVERPDAGEFRLNGQVIAQLGDHPALGGDIGILAYERGEFYFGGFNISNADGGAQASAGTGVPNSDPLPMFGNDEVRLIGVYLGVSNGIFMHEFGHALIGELQVPSTGPEEDAVDIFSALRVVEPTMYPSGDAQIDAIGREVAIYSALPWYYGGLISERSGEQMPWQDEHTGDLKRFRNVFCVIYGGNPGLYGNVAEQVGLDERTLSRCDAEFNRQNRAWRTILAPHTRVGPWHPEGELPADAPGEAIRVIFEPSSTRVGQFIIDTFSESLTGFADDFAKTYALPRELTVTYKDCGELNAWYSPDEASITMCYDLIEHLAVMISDIEMGTEGGMEVGAAQQDNSTSASATASAPSMGDSDMTAVDELVDLGVPPTSVLFPTPYRGATPAGHTKAPLLTTREVANYIEGEQAFMLVDTAGQAEVLPGSFSVPDFGKDGSVTDSFQNAVESWLQQNANGDKSMPIVFYGTGLQDRSSYNAALRAGALGWNAQWYRGGSEAWVANGLPLVAQQ